MKTKDRISHNRVSTGSRASLWAIGSLTALLAVCTPAFAQHSGGGGGGHGGGGHGGGFGGGGHSSGGGPGGGGAAGFGGGHAFAGGGYGGARGFSGGYSGARGYAGVGGARGYAGSYGSSGAHYSPRVGYSPTFRGANVASVHTYGHTGGGYAGRSTYVGHAAYGGGYGYGHGYGYGRGGFGWHRPYWGGGYWHGGYWPRAYYGWGYPWFLGVLPAVYATYWWGGIPYYYANDVYYTWDAGSSGYVVTDPPPVGGESDTAVGDGGYESADPGPAPSERPPSGNGSAEVYAYPKSGQSDEQQSTDKYECHRWAVAQSGFDPTHASQPSGNSADYRRAMVACLDGRGYSTR